MSLNSNTRMYRVDRYTEAGIRANRRDFGDPLGGEDEVESHENVELCCGHAQELIVALGVAGGVADIAERLKEVGCTEDEIAGDVPLSGVCRTCVADIEHRARRTGGTSARLDEP